MVHPTAAGATSSLGLVLSTVLLFRKLTHRRAWLFVVIVINTGLLYYSQSRSALLMTGVALTFCCIFLLPTDRRGFVLLCGGGCLLVFVMIDPGFELLDAGLRDVSSYVRRGQTSDQLRGVSGRAEMWEAIWKQFENSPLIGHGYFVTSSNGKLDVWEGPSNHDAHNIVLQVLVTTGAIGGVIFGWAMFRALRLVFLSAMRDMRHRRADRSQVDFLATILVLGVWYAGWSQGCVTFLGPIRPESVLFFAMLGLLAAYASETDHHHESVAAEAVA